MTVVYGAKVASEGDERSSVVGATGPVQLFPNDPSNWTDILLNENFMLSAKDTAVFHTRIDVVPEPTGFGLLLFASTIGLLLHRRNVAV